jgi:ElaB/YqjD/DUF883 family membrane-anchored ribosome-binding protein
MNQTTKDLKLELEKSAAILRTLRDEVRVQLHLGGMTAKDEWRKLEPRLESALERASKDVSDATRDAVVELTGAARKIRDSLK